MTRILFEEWYNPPFGGADEMAEEIRKYINKVYDGISIDKIAGSNSVTESDKAIYTTKKGDINLDLDTVYYTIRDNYDIIHAHCTGDKISNLNNKLNKPLVYTAHSLVIRELETISKAPISDLKKHPAAKKQEKMMKQSEVITTPSNYIANLIKTYYPEYYNKVKVIPNSTSFIKYKKNKHIESRSKQIRKKYSPNGEKLIAYVGRITKDKGVYELADAFKELVESGENIKLYYIGPYYEDSMKEINRRLRGYEYHYMFTGQLGKEELAAWYKAVDSVIIPTHHESFSIVGLETLSMETPLIISDIDGPKEILIDEGLAVGITPKDTKAIKNGIKYVIDNYNYEKKRAQIASKYIKDHYSIDKIVPEWVNLYKDILFQNKYSGVSVKKFSNIIT